MGPPLVFDSTCCLADHMNKVCQNVRYKLYPIGKNRKNLDKPTTEKYEFCKVTPRLDYCNSLLYGISGHLVPQLQRCQNNTARIVPLRRKYDNITPFLKELPWLPVEHGINCKILLLTYKAQHGMAPLYLPLLLSPYKPGRPLRYVSKHLFMTPRYRLEGFGKRCFTHAALPSGTRSLSPSSVLSPPTHTRSVWRRICLMMHIHNTTWHFIILRAFCPVSAGV